MAVYSPSQYLNRDFMGLRHTAQPLNLPVYTLNPAPAQPLITSFLRYLLRRFLPPSRLVPTRKKRGLAASLSRLRSVRCATSTSPPPARLPSPLPCSGRRGSSRCARPPSSPPTPTSAARPRADRSA